MNENIKAPNYVDGLMQDKVYGWLNTNKKGKAVAFPQKEHTVPFFRPECIEFKPIYQFQKFNKDSFDPFLRSINNQMSIKIRKDQDMSECRNILSAEAIEHEDQDPPHPTQSETAGLAHKASHHGPDVTTTETGDRKKKLAGDDPGSATAKTLNTENNLACDPAITTTKTSNTENNLACDPAITRTKTSNTENNLACDPAITTTKTSNTENNVKEGLPNISLPNLEGESSLTENVNACCLSKSLSLTSHIENLKQSMVLKSILSKHLQDLSEKLFSDLEIPVDTEARKNSHSSLFQSVHDKPPNSLEDIIFEKVQDLNSWLSKRDLLNSKSRVSPILKDIPTDSLSEDRPGNPPEVGREFVSEKHLETGEITFPVKKKSSFKKKHLENEVSSTKPSFSGTAYDYVIRQIFTAPAFSRLEMGVGESRETQMNWQNQYPTVLESLSSNILAHYKESNDEIELPEAKSVINQIIQAFPINTLLESGIIKVIELDKEYQKSSLLDTGTAFVKEKTKDSTKDYSEIKSKTNSLSKQNMPIIPKEASAFLNRVELIDNGQNISPQNSKYQSTSEEKTDLPSNDPSLDREENDLNSTLENLNNLLMGAFNASDATMLKSFLKNIFSVFFIYNQSVRRQPEKELERLIQHSFPNNIEDLEEIKENFDKADILDRKPSLSPNLCVFLEKLSESEIKNLKSELSKHIQHYLVERLSESGHITREDLPKIYQNLYLMNEEAEPKGQNVFLEKYSETVKEAISFINNFHHHFIDKHLEIKLRSFLNEILQNYFLKNISESSLFKETESELIHSNISLRTKNILIPFHKLGQDISKGSFGRKREVNMKCPLNESLQNYLISLSENELLNLKADLSKQLQRFFIEKLSKSGLISERQLEGISHHINLINSSSTPLKCIKPDLSFRDENQFMEEHSEKQNKYSNIVLKTTLQKIPENRLVETELTGKEKRDIKENPSIVREPKRYYPKERAKTLKLIKVQTSSNKNAHEIPLKKSSERLTDIVLKKERKEHSCIQLPQAEHFNFKMEIQDPHSWSGKTKVTQSNTCFERTLKMKSLDKKEYNDIYKFGVQEKPEVQSPYPRIPYCKMPNEDEEYVNKFAFASRQNNILTYFSSEAGENSKLEDQYYQRPKGYNNNNKKQHLVTSSHYKKEIQALHIKPSEICNEKCAKVLESHSFKYKVVEAEKSSKPSLFPEVLKSENLKPKVRKERGHVSKQKKSFNRIVKILPTTPPTTRILRKSVPRTLLHWTARRTIHDCLDRFENLHVTSFQHLEKAKSRGILLRRSPDDSHNWLKHSARPYTAPELNKQREGYNGKLTSPRMVSAGLVHLHATIPDYEIQKIWPKNN